MYEPVAESDFRKRIKNGIPEGRPHAYFFYGEEDYLKRSAVAAAKEAIVSDPFDLTEIGAATYTPEGLAASLGVPPLFSDHRLVVLTLSLTDLRPGEISDLCEAVSECTPDFPSVLLLDLPSSGFDAGTAKRPSALFKKLAEAAVPVRFDRITGARLNGWVGRHYAGHGVLAPAGVCAFTVSYCGNEMFRLASETDKISCYVLSQGRDAVTEEDVKTAGCPAGEFDAFALANAVTGGDRRLALDILAFLKSRREDPVKIMSDIIRVFCDMSAVNTCRKAGMDSRQISEATSIKPYPLSRYTAAIDSMKDPDRTLSRALALTAGADGGVKGYGRDYLPIEMLICSL